MTAPTPTQRWMEHAAGILEPLDGPEGAAERLLLLLYYGINWDGWLSAHRATFWEDQFPARITVSTYLFGYLRPWWSTIARELDSAPRNQAERRELAALLQYPDPEAVLTALRTQTDALVLRVRIITEQVRASREKTPELNVDQLPAQLRCSLCGAILWEGVDTKPGQLKKLLATHTCPNEPTLENL